MSSPITVAKKSPWVLPVILIVNAFAIAVAFQWQKMVDMIIEQYTEDDRTVITNVIYTLVMTILFVITVLSISQFPMIENHIG